MTASSQSFDDFLQNVNRYMRDAGSSLRTAGSAFNDTARGGLGANPLYQNHPRAAAIGRNLGGIADTAYNVGTQARVVAPLTLLGNFLDPSQGPVADVAGAGTAALLAKFSGPVANALGAIPVVGPALRVATPFAAAMLGNTVASNATQNLTNSIGNTYGAAVNNATTANISRAINPNDPRNLSTEARNAMREDFESLSKMYGEEYARQMLTVMEMMKESRKAKEDDVKNALLAGPAATYSRNSSKMIDQLGNLGVTSANAVGTVANSIVNRPNPYVSLFG